MDIMRFFPVLGRHAISKPVPGRRPEKLARRLLHRSAKHRQWALCRVEEKAMAKATLTISSKNYSSWSLRGWLLAKFSGLEFDEVVTAPDDPSANAEILLLSSSILVPCLRHGGATGWETLAI